VISRLALPAQKNPSLYQVKKITRHIRVSRDSNGSKKLSKKFKKKLASPRRVPLNGNLTRQMGPEDRSKKL
jgi:hypothetical protein